MRTGLFVAAIVPANCSIPVRLYGEGTALSRHNGEDAGHTSFDRCMPSRPLWFVDKREGEEGDYFQIGGRIP